MAAPRLSSYERLDGREVRAVIEYLGERIDQYLPRHPGLRSVTEELGRLVDGLLDRERGAPRRRRAVMWVSRVLIAVVLVTVVLTVGAAVRDAIGAQGALHAFEWLPVLDSGISDLVFAGIAIWFLLSLAGRLVRNELLRRLHRLRSLAHIIDMHQMSKDPAALLPDTEVATPAGRDEISPR